MTDTGKEILQTIIDDPDDIAARLVYADYLDENPLPPIQCLFCRGEGSIGFVIGKINCRFCRGRGSTPDELRPAHARLIRVQCSQPGTDPKETGILIGPCSELFGKNVDNRFTHTTALKSFGLRRCIVAGGFVERVHCELSLWEEYGPALVREQPIRYVEVTDKTPFSYTRPATADTVWYWQWHYPGVGSRTAVPEYLYHLVQPLKPPCSDWPTERAARDALSTVLISSAKERKPQ